MRRLVLAAIAWSLLSPPSLSQKEYPWLEEIIREKLDALDKAGETWLAALEQSAEDGHIASQAELCTVYSDGFIVVNNKGMKVPLDYSKALKLCRKAAEQGDGRAQYELGEMYYKGKGVPQHYREAFKWYRKAARQGVWIAKGELGMMYYHGIGTLQDYVKAYAWLNLAAARGDMGQVWREIIVSTRDQVREKMTTAQVAEGQKLAAELQERIEASKSK